MSERVLQFTIGPVQGFVGEARRTRDYWSGSFLLSYLAGCAMSAVLNAGGGIVVPSVGGPSSDAVTDELLTAILKRAAGDTIDSGPCIGTLPNRFRAIVPASFNPAECVTALKKHWNIVCERVWRDYVEPVAVLGHETKMIWKRQVEGFWDIAWVLGDDFNLLDRRKNWRSYVPTVELGDKCSIMGSLQELSGHLRGDDQDVFWNALRNGVPGFDLREDERLCAVVLVKRLFPHVAKATIGWAVPHKYPSTPYVAAVHWLDKTIRAMPKEAREYAGHVQVAFGEQSSEDPGAFACLARTVKEYPDARVFAGLNGNCFSRAALENPRLWETGTDEARRGLVDALGVLSRRCGAPSPFYSLLVMDGDEMGALLREYDPGGVSRSLGAFARRVPEVVAKHNGVTVYAGGDDVLALLPLEDALAASVALREEYRSSFKSAGIPGEKGTLSGAIVYAHYTTPLKTVIHEGQYLLDSVAKDTTGRDSLAIAVWNTGGRALTWSAPWGAFVTEKGMLFDHVIKALGVQDDDGGLFNSTFFYNLRERFSTLAGLVNDGEHMLSDDDARDLLAAEYMRSRERECTIDQARERMGKVLHLCRTFRRVSGRVVEIEGSLDFSALILARFLAQKGVTR